MMCRSIFRPVKCRPVISQHSQRRVPRMRPFSHGQVAIKGGREENAFRVRIEQDLLWIETVQLRNRLSSYGIRVITSVTQLCNRDPAVPNPPRLVVQKIKGKRQGGIYQIGRRIEQ